MTRSAMTRGIVSGGLWSVSKIAASALATPFIARLIGAEGYGQYAYYLAIIFLASAFANWGITITLTKHLAQWVDDPQRQWALIGWCGRLHLGSTILVASGLAWGLWSLNGAEPLARWIVPAVVTAVLGEQVWYFARGIIYGLRCEPLANGPAVVGVILSPLLGMGLAVVGYGVAGMLWGLAIANGLTALLTVWLMWRRKVTRAVTDRLGVRAASITPQLPTRWLWQFGTASMLYSALSLGLYRLDAVLIRWWSNDVEAGLYAAAVQWSEFTWFVAMAVEMVMLQATAHLWASAQTDVLVKMLNRALRYVLLGTTFLLLMVCVFAAPILELYYGANFVVAHWPLRVLAPGVGAFALARVLGPAIQARGNMRALIGAAAAASVLNVMFNWLWLPRWGAVGAAAATTSAYVFVLVVYLWLMRAYGVNLEVGRALRALLMVCLVTGSIALPMALLMPASLLTIVLGSAISLIVYGYSAFKLGLLHSTEVELVIDTLRSRLPSSPLFHRL